MKLVATCVLFVLSMSGSARGAVLHVVGDEPVPMQVLKRVLEGAGHQVTLFEQKEFASSGALKPAAILMYVHDELEESVGKRLIAFTREGGRLIILHHGIASAKNKSPYWMEFVGMEILPKTAPEYPWTVIYGVEFEIVNVRVSPRLCARCQGRGPDHRSIAPRRRGRKAGLSGRVNRYAGPQWGAGGVLRL